MTIHLSDCPDYVRVEFLLDKATIMKFSHACLVNDISVDECAEELFARYSWKTFDSKKNSTAT